MFIDCHAHVNFAAFKDDWLEVIQRTLQNGTWLVNVGTQRDTSRRAIEIAKDYPEGVYATIGLHPIHTYPSFHDSAEIGSADGGGFTSRGEEFDYSSFSDMAKDPKVVAIGECGLDYYHPDNAGNIDQAIRDKQKKAFEAQISLAREVKKPLMIHSRDAFPDTFEILKSSGVREGIAHSFVRDVEEAKKLLELGFYFTLAGNITFKPRPDKPSPDEVIRYLPLDRILSETDAPYLAPVPHRGKRNEPLYVLEVVKKLAELKNIPVAEMADHIFRNAQRIFKLAQG